MDRDVLYFFNGKPEALPLYEAFEEKVFSEVDNVKVKVQKTQHKALQSAPVSR